MKLDISNISQQELQDGAIAILDKGTRKGTRQIKIAIADDPFTGYERASPHFEQTSHHSEDTRLLFRDKLRESHHIYDIRELESLAGVGCNHVKSGLHTIKGNTNPPDLTEAQAQRLAEAAINPLNTFGIPIRDAMDIVKGPDGEALPMRNVIAKLGNVIQSVGRDPRRTHQDATKRLQGDPDGFAKLVGKTAEQIRNEKERAF